MYNFQFCQKIILFTEDRRSILLARRAGEQDYDAIFSLIGGKMEHRDSSFVEGLKREKDEEIGGQAHVRVCPGVSYNVLFVKKDGSHMVLPHYIATYQGGTIELNDEYSEYAWVTLDALEAFEPKIANIPEVVSWAQRILPVLNASDFIDI